MKKPLCRLLLLALGLLGSSVPAADVDTRPIDLVAFFKRATSSPPDVDKFVAGQESFLSEEDFKFLKQASGLTNRHVPFYFYAGARSSSNFFIARLGTNDSDALVGANFLQQVNGRVGGTLYDRRSNSISIGLGSNTFAKVTATAFIQVNQLLNMGMGDINPKSVAWNGNNFTAQSLGNQPEYGHLHVSNGIPTRLEIHQGTSRDASLLKIYEYRYPDPPDLYGGFPVETTLLRADGAITARMIFKAVHLAPKPLTEEFFQHTRFGGTNRIPTNIYNHADTFFSRKSDGKLLQVGVDIPAE